MEVNRDYAARLVFCFVFFSYWEIWGFLCGHSEEGLRTAPGVPTCPMTTPRVRADRCPPVVQKWPVTSEEPEPEAELRRGDRVPPSASGFYFGNAALRARRRGAYVSDFPPLFPSVLTVCQYCGEAAPARSTLTCPPWFPPSQHRPIVSVPSQTHWSRERYFPSLLHYNRYKLFFPPPPKIHMTAGLRHHCKPYSEKYTTTP